MNNKCRTKNREPDLDELWAKVPSPMSDPLMAMVVTFRGRRIELPLMRIAGPRPSLTRFQACRRASGHNLKQILGGQEFPGL
ncbi:hypothetical protein FA04_29380 (plasmid) [Ensifer adhaerens]|nr:hypothetical protein FA04_29380 [Ensifer adhaerens]KDP75391.1 hypothetical protein FA04_00935 [Ensifer adhaerens]KQZ52913.1 hypothetical protein ASD63_30010 [Ensifer sp. Root558]